MSFSIYCKSDEWTLNPFGPLNLYLNCVYFMNMDTIYSCHYKADVAQLKEIRVHEGNLMCKADMNFNLNFPETFFHSIEQHLLAGME